MPVQVSNAADWNNLLILANAGDNAAQYKIASFYDFGLKIDEIEIVAKNKVKAFEWYNSAYKNGNDEAIIRTADFLSEGVYCDLNIELAIELYDKAIQQGSGIAANNLAVVYRDKQDYEKAFELYTLAQNLYQSNSLSVALCHYYGIGTQKNIEIALEILLKISKDTTEFCSCQYEIDEANYLLGKIYLDGVVVEQSFIKARYFLQLADADNDHRSAQELLSIIGRDV